MDVVPFNVQPTFLLVVLRPQFEALKTLAEQVDYHLIDIDLISSQVGMSRWM